MSAGTRILDFADATTNDGDALGTLVAGVMLLLVGLVLLVMSTSRMSRLGAAGIILWGATLVIPIAAGM